MSLSLALDALESAKRLPTAPLLWQALTQHGLDLAATERQALAQQVARLPQATPAAEWLRCSALAHLGNDLNWLYRQAACADASFSADALMSLLGLLWGKALLESPSHPLFADLLIKADAARLQRLVAAQVATPRQADRPSGNGRLCVAVLTPEIASLQHGGTALTLRAMNLLAQLGHVVKAFSAKEMSIPHIASYHGGKEYIEPLPVQIDALHLPSHPDVQLKIWDHRFSLRSRLDKALQAIEAFAPDLVLFVGFLSPLVQRLHERYPVLGLSVHAMPPLAPVDVWLCANPESAAAPWPDLPVPLALAFPYRFVPAGPVTAVDRRTAGLPPKALLLVTAGFRLDRELTLPWIQQMLTFLEAHPAVHWLLIGVADHQRLPALPQHPRIHRVPPQHQLAAWLAMGDICVNPPRVGGGGSVAMAMEQGLAVACMAGGDGGDKLGPLAAASTDRYFDQLSVWVRQPETRRAAGEALRQRFHERLDLSSPNALRSLAQACQAAAERHRRRRETADA